MKRQMNHFNKSYTMKSNTKLTGCLFFLAMLLISTPGFASFSEDDELVDTTKFNAYYGKVVDDETGRSLPFATIEAVGTNAATVSNIDGEFTIKIARDADVSQLKISYIGFKNHMLPLSQFRGTRTLTVRLKSSTIQLKEITVRPQNALELIMDALSAVRVNYSRDPMMMRGFYRETVQRGRNYVSISEAVWIYLKEPIPMISRSIR